MSTKRLLVSLDKEVLAQIEHLAKLTHESLSKVAKDLIISSLELEEDKVLSKLADQRAETTQQWVTHLDAWQ